MKRCTYWACEQYPACPVGSTNLGEAHRAQSPPQGEIERETDQQMVL